MNKTIFSRNGEVNYNALARLTGLSNPTIRIRILENRDVFSVSQTRHAHRARIQHKINQFRASHPESNYFDNQGRYLGRHKVPVAHKHTAPAAPAVSSIPQGDFESEYQAFLDRKNALLNRSRDRLVDLIIQCDDLEKLISLIDQI